MFASVSHLVEERVLSLLWEWSRFLVLELGQPIGARMLFAANDSPPASQQKEKQKVWPFLSSSYLNSRQDEIENLGLVGA